MEVRHIDWCDLPVGQLLAHAVILAHHSGVTQGTSLFTRYVDSGGNNVMTKVHTLYDDKE